MTVNGDTLSSAIIESSGATNVFRNHPHRYPEITDEELLQSRPQVVLLPSEPYEFSEQQAKRMEAFLDGASVLCIPGEWVTWYGCRVGRAIESLRETLGLGRIHLVGHSWGGLLAMLYAIEHPEHLRSLLREVYEDRDGAGRRGRAAAEEIARDWTWDRTARVIEERLAAIAG